MLCAGTDLFALKRCKNPQCPRSGIIVLDKYKYCDGAQSLTISDKSKPCHPLFKIHGHELPAFGNLDVGNDIICRNCLLSAPCDKPEGIVHPSEICPDESDCKNSIILDSDGNAVGCVGMNFAQGSLNPEIVVFRHKPCVFALQPSSTVPPQRYMQAPQGPKATPPNVHTFPHRPCPANCIGFVSFCAGRISGQPVKYNFVCIPCLKGEPCTRTEIGAFHPDHMCDFGFQCRRDKILDPDTGQPIGCKHTKKGRCHVYRYAETSAGLPQADHRSLDPLGDGPPETSPTTASPLRLGGDESGDEVEDGSSTTSEPQSAEVQAQSPDSEQSPPSTLSSDPEDIGKEWAQKAGYLHLPCTLFDTQKQPYHREFVCTTCLKNNDPNPNYRCGIPHKGLSVFHPKRTCPDQAAGRSCRCKKILDPDTEQPIGCIHDNIQPNPPQVFKYRPPINQTDAQAPHSNIDAEDMFPVAPEEVPQPVYGQGDCCPPEHCWEPYQAQGQAYGAPQHWQQPYNPDEGFCRPLQPYFTPQPPFGTIHIECASSLDGQEFQYYNSVCAACLGSPDHECVRAVPGVFHPSIDVCPFFNTPEGCQGHPIFDLHENIIGCVHEVMLNGNSFPFVYRQPIQTPSEDDAYGAPYEQNND